MLLASLATCAAAALLPPAPPQDGWPVVGEPAPRLQSVLWRHGDAVRSYAPGRVTVVFLFATWSDGLDPMLARLDALARRHPEDLDVAGVVLFPRGHVESTEDFLERRGDSLAFGIAEDVADGTVEGLGLNVTLIPLVLVVDQEGVLVQRAFHLEGLEDLVDALLAGDLRPGDGRRRLPPAGGASRREVSALHDELFELGFARDWEGVERAARRILELEPEFPLVRSRTSTRPSSTWAATRRPASSPTRSSQRTRAEDVQPILTLARTILSIAEELGEQDPDHPGIDLARAQRALEHADRLTGETDELVWQDLGRVCFARGDVVAAIAWQERVVAARAGWEPFETMARETLQEYEAARDR